MTMLPIPQHVGIIMDGNRRWAKQHGLPVLQGHKHGMDALTEVVKESLSLGIQHMTVFGFSTENWRRPLEEVRGLMNLFRMYTKENVKSLKAQGVSLRFIGDRSLMDPDIQQIMHESEQLTASCDKLTLRIALSYGARQEITAAFKKIAEKILHREIQINQITPELISAHLETAGVPDPDVIIRTSGECRLSNFLLWQAEYSEFIFTEVLWPDITREKFKHLINDYCKRERRYGKTSEQIQDDTHELV